MNILRGLLVALVAAFTASLAQAQSEAGYGAWLSDGVVKLGQELELVVVIENFVIGGGGGH